MRWLCLGFLGLFTHTLDANVGKNGAFTHTIPLQLPAGTAGMQPSLAIAYDSNQGNGPLGVGFSLRGIPVIARGNYDRGINYDGQDSYFTGSGRLIDVSGNKTAYHSAEESWAKYEPIGACGDGPCSWIMTDRNGVRYEFGSTLDSQVARQDTRQTMESTPTQQLRNHKCMMVNCSDGPTGCTRWVYDPDGPGGIAIEEYYCSYYETVMVPNAVTSTVVGPGVRVWALNKVTDLRQNSYTISYRQDSGQYYVDKIRYTYGPGLSYLKTVSFSYDISGRPDKEAQNTHGGEVKTNWRLSRVSVDFETSCYWFFTCNQHVRNYDLSYDISASTGSSRITAIQEFGADGSALPAITFAWQEGGAGVLASGNYTFHGAIGYNKAVAGDFNGDGKADLLKITPDSKIWLMLASSGDGTFNSWGSTSTPEDGYSGLIAADINGDGKSDIIKYTPDFTQWLTYFSNGDGSFRAVSWMGSQEIGYSNLIPADINADGKMDLIKYTNDGMNILTYISNGDGTFTRNYQYNPEVGYSRLQFADADGDGKVDAIRSIPDARLVLLQKGNGDGTFANATSSYDSNAHADLILADLNGDGLPDLVKTDSGFRNFRTFLNTGKGAFVAAGMTSSGEVGYSGIVVVDLNGDGKQDLVKYTPDVRQFLTYVSDGKGNFPLRGYLNEVSVGYSGLIAADVRGTGRSDLIKYTSDMTNIIDLRGNQTASDLMTSSSQNGAVTTIEYASTATIVGAIQPASTAPGNASTFPRNVVTKVTIQSDKDLDQNGELDTFSTSYAYTNGRFFSGYMPDRTDLGFQQIQTTDVNSGNYSITTYRQDKPFHGMPLSTVSYIANGTKVSEIQYGTPEQYYCNDAGCNFNGTNDATPTQPRQVRPGTMTHIKYINPSVSGSVAIITTISQNLAYDIYGNITHTVQTKNAGAGTYTSHSYAEYINDISGANTRAVGLLYHTKACVEDCSVFNTKEEKLFIYDGQVAGTVGALHEVTQTQSKLGSITLTKNFTYTANGNIASFTDDTGATVAMTYEPNYRTFVQKTVFTPGTGANATTTYTIEKETHPAFGAVVWSKNNDGLQSEADVDAFGRITAQRLKDSSGNLLKRSTTQYRTWGNSNAADHFTKSCANYKTSATDAGISGEMCSYEYSDALGRPYLKISAEIQGPQLPYRAVQIVYDAQNRVSTESMPYIKANVSSDIGSPETFRKNIYDAYGRVWREIAPDGSATQLEVGYAGNGLVSQLTTDPRGIKRETLTDARGLTLKIIEAKGTAQESGTSYAFYSNGLLESVTSPQGVTILTYDAETKQQLSIADPHAGTTVFTYEKSPLSPAFGKLVSETRPDPHAASGALTTLNQYADVWGRITQTTKADGSVLTYVYDEAIYGFGAGKLTTTSFQTQGYTVADHFRRDILGNIVSTQRNISHGTLTLCDNPNDMPCTSTVAAEIDALDRKRGATLSDGTVSQFLYRGGTNQLANLTHDGITYAAYGDYNKFGKPEKITYGNGTQAQYAFRPSGVTDHFQIKKTGTALADYQFGYDENYNIKLLADRLVAGNANDLNFTYDSLERLKTAQRGQNNAHPFAFDTDGANGASQGKLKTNGLRRMQYATNSIRPSGDEIWDTQTNTWQQNATMAWSPSGNLLSRGTSTYQYNADNMLKHSSDPDRGDADYFYDASGQRFLKIFKRQGLPAVKTWYLAGDIELREKWSEDLTQKYGAQSTKYIFGPDGKRLASVTGSTTLASAQMAQRYYAMADMYSSGSTGGLALKAKFTFYAFMQDQPAQKKAYWAGLILLAFLLLLYIRLTPGEVGWDQVKSHSKRFVAAIMVASFVSANCGSNVVNNVGTYGGVTVDFNDIYSGLPAGTVYYHSDHLGSTTILTDANGDEIFRLAYDAYGSLDISNSGKLNRTTMEIERVSSMAGYAALAVRYTGQEYDPETGFYYYNARYYSSELGIFTSADTYVPDPKSAMSYNRHMYVRGNPINKIDPTGHEDIVYFGIGTGGINVGYERNGTRYGGTIPVGMPTNGGNSSGSNSGIAQNGGSYGNSGYYSSGGSGLGTGRGGYGDYLMAYVFTGRPSSGSGYGFSNFADSGPYFGCPTNLYAASNDRRVMNDADPVYALELPGNHAARQAQINSNIHYAPLYNALDQWRNDVITSAIVGGMARFANIGGGGVITGVNGTRGWRVGQPINNLTGAGNVPAWSTVRQRYWKNEAFYNSGNYELQDLLRLEKGLAPQRFNEITGRMESKELHHAPPQRFGGLFDVEAVWPEEHAARDAFRHIGAY